MKDFLITLKEMEGGLIVVNFISSTISLFLFCMRYLGIKTFQNFIQESFILINIKKIQHNINFMIHHFQLKYKDKLVSNDEM
jgi:hypothetical protein